MNATATALRRLGSILTPPPRLNCRQWADDFRYLSRESSAQPGKYLSARAPYQREPMEAVTDPNVGNVCLRWAAQLGKTEIVCNVVGFFIAADPAPILVVQPTVEMAEAWSKERLAPMLRDTPALWDRVRSPRSRDSENTILHKTFPGGNVAIVGANAPSGLAGRPRRVILLDEIDRYPPSAGTEGDPCALAERRAESFWNALIFRTSTPTIRGASRIDVAWEQSDGREWHCPCPRCGFVQTLRWAQVKWPKGRPEDARYECAGCAAQLIDEERVLMVRRGRWIAARPDRRARGFHLNGLATLFKARRGYVNRLHQMAAQFLEAQAGGQLTLRVWINTFLAESWEEDVERIEATELAKRREAWGEKLPLGVLLLTAGVDVQGDRLELEVVGWGLGEESWGVQVLVIPGKPDDPETWAKLDVELLRTWRREDDVELRVVAAGVDASAFTDFVFKFTKRRFARNVLGVKGSNQPNAPVISGVRRNNRFKAASVAVGTDQAKSLLYSRLKLIEPGPGFLHFGPETAGYTEAWFSGLTAEEMRVRFHKGFAVREWHKVKSRNEPLDVRVYAYAMLRYLNPNWTRLAAGLERRRAGPSALQTRAEAAGEPAAPTSQATPRPARRPARRGFVGGWRRY